MVANLDIELLRNNFGDRMQENIPLARHTTSRVGGQARVFVTANSADELASDVQYLWNNNIPLLLIGSGANMLVSDQGIEAVVILNRAKAITFPVAGTRQFVKAESGAALVTVAREAGQKGFSGLEWASTIPGTVGGAVYGNAGAHGGDTSKTLFMAEILHREQGRLSFTAKQMAYSYRSSILKRQPGNAVILSASFAVHPGNTAEILASMQANAEKRRNSQPLGPSMGSTFKNPPGDHSARLIEAAGLKGTKIGGVEISPIHANFLVNDGTATAEDYRQMIQFIQKTIQEKFDVKLELEIELLGNWQEK